MPGLLDGELRETARLRVLSAQFQLMADEVSQATLTIPEDGPIVKLRDWIALYDAAGLLGVYRVTNITQTVRRQIQLTLLHGIDVLADSCWAAETEYQGKPRGYLEAALNQQTALIDGAKPWALGTCEDTETDLDEKVSYGRLSELVPRAVEEGGAYQFEYDQSAFPWTVSLTRKPAAAACEFRLARNITSATITYNDADLCTRLILSNTSGGESRVRVYDAGAAIQAEWGVVTKTASIDTSDNLDAASWPEAEAWVAAFFAKHAAPSVQIQIEGRELYSLTGEEWDRASLGRMCRVALPDYGHTFLERVVSITYPDPYGDPDRVVVSLANALPKFSETVKLLEKTARSASGTARAAQQKAEEAAQNVVVYRTELIKSDREITALASATGLQFNADGTPVLDENGEFVYNPDAPDSAIISQLSVQAGNISSLVETTSGLSSRVTQTESAISTEVTNRTNADNALSSRVSQTESSWSALVQAVGADGQVTAASIATKIIDDASLIEALADEIDLNALAGDINLSSLAGNINLNALAGRITLTSQQLDVIAENVTLTAEELAVVAQQVDIATGLANITGTAQVGGGLNVYGGITTDNGTSIGSDGDLSCVDDLVVGDSVYIGGSKLAANKLNPVNSITLVPPSGSGTTYTLKYTDLGGTEHTVGTFSRAASVSNVSGSWNGSTLTVAADPNSTDASFVTNISAGVKMTGTSEAVTLGYNASDHKYYIRGQAYADGTEVAGINTTTGTEAYTAGEAAGWTDAEGKLAIPTENKTSPSAFMTVYYPDQTKSSKQSSVTYTLTDNSGEHKVQLKVGNNVVAEQAYTPGTTVNVESSHSHTMTANSQTVTPSSGYDAMAQVTVNATNLVNTAVSNAKSDVTVSGTWSSGAITIANSANSKTIVDYLRGGTASWSGTTVTIPVQHSTTPSSTSSFANTGQSVSVNVNNKLYSPGTITPTTSTQTISVPSGYIGFAGPLTIAAASGGGGFNAFSGFTDNPNISDNEYTPYEGGTISGSKTIYAVVENAEGALYAGPHITVSAPTAKVISAKATTITSNGTYYASDDNVDGWSSVTVDVSSGTSYSYSATLKMYTLENYNMVNGDNRVYVKTPTGSYNPISSGYTRIYVLSDGTRVPDNTTVHW